MKKILLLAGILVFNLPGADILKLATTTSTYETGLLDSILPPFEKMHGVKVHCISVGTGKAIKLGERGDVDVIMVHARDAEDKFIAEGYGVNRRDLMYNEYVLLGPEKDPAGIGALKDAAEAFKSIQKSGAVFVSRGDNSGTHLKERAIWEKAGLKPGGPAYLDVGQGMSATLRIADEKDAYVVMDRATYYAQERKLRLKLLVEGDPALFNPYGVIAVSPYRHPHVKYQLSMALIGWLTSPECLQRIEEFKKDGHRLFIPNASEPKR